MKKREGTAPPQKKPEKETPRQRVLLSQVIDFLPDPTFAIDRAGRVTVWNRAMEEMTGVKARDMVGKGDYEYAVPFYGERRPILADLVLHPDPERERSYSSLIRQGDSLYAETIGLPSRRFLWGKASPIRDRRGTITGAIESIRDITDHKHIEETVIKSEARYRDIFENVSDYLYLHDLDGVFIETNFANKKESGFSEEELNSLSIRDLLPDRHRHRFQNYMKNVVDKGRDEGFLTIVFKDGQERVLEYRNSLITDNQGWPVAVRGSARDITARLKAQKELKRERDFITTIIQTSPAFYVAMDPAGRIILMNEAMLASLNYGLKAVLGRDFVTTLVHPEDQAFIARGISDMTSSSRSTVLMLRMISRDGRDMLVQWQYKPVHKTDGGIDFIFGMGIDITGQKRAEELGRISEKKFQAAFHASADPMAIFDPPTGRIIDVNTAFVTWSGYTADEAIGRTTMDLDIWQDPSDRDRYIGRLRLGETVDREEVRLRNRTGAQYIVILSAAMVEVEGRSYLFLTLHDITDLRNAQTRLAKSERHYRLLAENASDVIWVLNPDLTYRFVSPSVENLRGYTVKEVLGQTLRDVLTPESYRNAMELMQRERLQEVSGHRHGPQWSTTAEFEMTRRDGTTVWTEARLSVLYDDEGKVSGILGITRDITQRKQAETALRERQRQMETLMGNLPGMAYRCRNDENWTMEFVSQGCLDITGYSPEDLVGSARVSYAGLIHPEDRDPVWSQVQEALSRREHFRLTYRIIHRDTGVRWVWEQGTGVPDTDGRVAFLEGFITDITERKLAEEALRKSEERYRLLAENVRDVIWVLDMDLRYTYISPSVERMRGFTVEEAMGMPLDKVMTPEFYQLALTVIGEELERERHGLIHDPYWSRTIEGQILHKDGSFLWVEITATFLRDDDGNITGILGVTRDISKRRHAEDVLQQIRFAVEHLGEEAFWISREGRFIYVNEASCRALGCTREELLSMGVQDIDPLFQPDRWPEHWQELKERGSLVFESIHRRKNGSEYPVEIQANFLEFGGQEFNWAFARDITERKHADAKLRESEERFRRMAEVSPEVFWMTSPDWSRVIYLSPAFEKIFGFPAEELVQNPSACLGLIHEQDRDAVISFFRRSQGPDAVYEFRIVRPDGSVRWIRNRRSSVLDEQGRTILLVGIAEDITERVQAEEERKVFEARLARSQKLEAIGTLAGGIAHDFNNILSAIIGYSELAQEELPASSPAHASLAEVIRAGDRAKDLVRQILTFSRQMETERKPVRVQLIVKEVMKLLRSSIPRTITIRDSVDPSAGPVFADPTQIHQVIMNLCTNAYHAMLPAGGELTISVDSVFLDAHFASQHPELREGAYLRLAVQDTGTGMDPETMKRIFDPFFTTKEKTKGTGLGLATVHGIVTDLGGSVMVTSTVGKGSTFEVYLPVSKKQEDEDEEPEEELGKGRGQTILLVDDEEAILHFTGTMLEQLGYLVIRTSSSLEALGMFRSNPQGIDLVITDQTMPGLTGMALASEIIRTRPGIPVILMTGYSETVSPEEALAQGIEEYIEKPFTRSTLARSVQRCLSEKNRS